MTGRDLQEADLAVSAFRPTASRARVADFTTPYDFEDALLVLKAPRDYSNSDDRFFLQPFRPAVFAVVGGCVLLLVLLLLLSRFCMWYQRGRDARDKPDVMQWLLADVEMVVAGLLSRCKM